MSLNKTDAEEVVKIFLQTLAQKNPALKPEIFAVFKNENLLNTMRDLLLQMKPDLTKKDLADKEILKQITVAFVAVMTLSKLSLDHNKDFLNKIKLILDKKDINLLKDKDALKKLFTPEEMKQLQEEIKNGFAEVFHELKKYGLMKPEPGAKKKPEEALSENETFCVNLFGLVSNQAGSLPAVVQCFLGNGLNFPDLNPNPGMANIDRFNRVDDPQISTEYKQQAETNYIQFAGSEIVEALEEALGDKGLASKHHAIPGPHPPIPGEL